MKHSMSSKSVEKRKKVIVRLEKQLQENIKPLKWFNENLNRIVQSPVEFVPLTDSDKHRIQKEIEILKTRI